MKQPRRYRWLKLSVFLIAYSVFHQVLSAPSEPEQTKDTPEATKIRPKPKETPKLNEKTIAKIEEDFENGEIKKEVIKEIEITKEGEDKNGKKEEITIKEVTLKEEFEPTEKEGKEGGRKENKEGGKKDEAKGGETKEKEEEKTEKGGKNKQKDFTKLESSTTMATFPDVGATLRARRENCTPPAIEQFPRPLMGPTARRHGGLVIHFLVAIFTFVGLAIVCDEYFVSSLDRICEELKLAPDVAGATFMAAGSSAPELATVIIGVFWAQDDIGVSGVIGSAVFNIMFVISVCALCAGTVSHLNWWPLCRDCFFYAISILVMLCTIWDGFVTRGEAIFMLIMYVVYCVALHFNSRLEHWSAGLKLPFKLPTKEEQAALVTYKTAVGDKPANGDGSYDKVEGTTQETPLQNAGYTGDGAYENVGYNAEPPQSWDPSQSWDPNQSWGEDNQNQAPVWDPNSTWNSGQQPPQQRPPPQRQLSETPEDPKVKTSQQLTIQPAAPAQNYYRPKEYNPETAVNPLVKPENANIWQLIFFYVAFPVHWSARKTMPDCRGRWYPVTFCVSMLWISFYSYFMVWMITIIGSTLSIPDTVMGLTFVAAGVSVPDALSSLAVIKEGYGDMAVSNAVGSNVFDILVCLGLPWFIQTAIIKPGSSVNVISKGLIYSTLSLFSTVVFLVVATHANGWKLDRKYGVILMVWYLLFITFASLYELNVFGNHHPPDCPSMF